MKLYNTLTRQKEEFIPIAKGKISMYVCGPTVYDYCHLGHAKGYVSMDIVRRYLEWIGYDVKYVQNFTDVGHLTDDADEGEDKIEKRAKRDKVDPLKLAQIFIDSYYKDFRSLNVKDPNIAPRPTQEIPDIIDFIQKLIEKEYAYESNGSVYFRVEKFKKYGKLSGRKIEDLISGSRVSIRTEKESPLDFALWIKAEPGHILKWPSSWSEGYPGWHIECSVMSQKYLGDTFDIHGGGLENIFPHNESEIAQSEALTGQPMAHYWILWNMVLIDSEKMSKSKNNFTTIRDLLKKYDPMVVRLAIIKSHYRSPIDFNEEIFDEATNNLLTIKDFILKLKVITGKSNSPIEPLLNRTLIAFEDAMNDDFNTPKAVAVLFDFMKEVNKKVTQGLAKTDAEKVLGLLFDLDRVFGLELNKVVATKGNEEIEALLAERTKAKDTRDWKKADVVREKIRKQGFDVEDTPAGQVLKKL